jgi:hypothetical protein
VAPKRRLGRLPAGLLSFMRRGADAQDLRALSWRARRRLSDYTRFLREPDASSASLQTSIVTLELEAPAWRCAACAGATHARRATKRSGERRARARHANGAPSRRWHRRAV